MASVGMPNADRGHGRRHQIRVRVTEAEARSFAEMAEISGLSLSSWARMVLRTSALNGLRQAGRKSEISDLGDSRGDL